MALIEQFPSFVEENVPKSQQLPGIYENTAKRIDSAIASGLAFGPIGAQIGAAISGLRGSLNTDVPVTPMPEEQAALQEQQEQSIQDYKEVLGDLYPVLLSQYGYTEGEDGKLRRLTEEERIANMTPLERQQYQNALLQQQFANELMPSQLELAKAQADYALKAQRGELELPEYLNQDLEEMKALENQRLSQRLGTNWYMSSPGIETADKASRREAAIKSAYAHGEKTTGANLLSQSLGGLQSSGGQSFGGYLTGTQAGQQGFLSGAQFGTGAYGQLPGMYGQAQSPYMYYAGLQNQANMQSAANQAGLIGDVFGLAGTLGGAAIGGV